MVPPCRMLDHALAQVPRSRLPARIACMVHRMHPSSLLAAARARVAALQASLTASDGEPATLVETHISWLLLGRSTAYKLKKPLKLPFLDATTLAARRGFCDEELRLNRRLAPSLYLDVV